MPRVCVDFSFFFPLFLEGGGGEGGAGGGGEEGESTPQIVCAKIKIMNNNGICSDTLHMKPRVIFKKT